MEILLAKPEGKALAMPPTGRRALARQAARAPERAPGRRKGRPSARASPRTQQAWGRPAVLVTLRAMPLQRPTAEMPEMRLATTLCSLAVPVALLRLGL